MYIVDYSKLKVIYNVFWKEEGSDRVLSIFLQMVMIYPSNIPAVKVKSKSIKKWWNIIILKIGNKHKCKLDEGSESMFKKYFYCESVPPNKYILYIFVVNTITTQCFSTSPQVYPCFFSNKARKNIIMVLRWRIIFAILGSIGMAIIYGLKVNLSMTIVPMVNQTAVKSGIDSHGNFNYNIFSFPRKCVS